MNKNLETAFNNFIEQHLSSGYSKDDFTLQEWKILYFAESICDLTTYDDYLSIEFGKEILEVFNIIKSRTNFEYIEDKTNYKRYIMVCNLVNTKKWLDWGTSIRGAWFNYDTIKIYEYLSGEPAEIKIEEIIEWVNQNE